jgi:uncharacterized protein YaiE (UPF0345 family)
VAGSCRVKLDGAEGFGEYVAGSSFDVPGQSGFTVRVESGITEYVCSFA